MLEIIENKCIRTVFQPIVSLKNGTVLGHEALSRITCECPIKSPGDLFVYAEEFGCLWELELLCRTAALEKAFLSMEPPYNKKLFLNVNSNIMNDAAFIKGFTKSFLQQYQIDPEAVVFEISERIMITDIDGFCNTIRHYTEQGFEIAVDDVGAGFSGLNLISSIGPTYMKLDMNLVHDIDKNKLKRAIVKSMTDLSRTSNMILIAEGIETASELETLIEIGVAYGQGYYLQMPESVISPLANDLIEEIKKFQIKSSVFLVKNYLEKIIPPLPERYSHFFTKDAIQDFDFKLVKNGTITDFNEALSYAYFCSSGVSNSCSTEE